MGTVTGLREFRGVVIVAVDGCDALRVRKAHFEKRPLREGDAVDLEAYEDAVAALQLADAYEAALTSLDFRARTRSELQRALLAKGYVRPAVDAVLERLREKPAHRRRPHRRAHRRGKRRQAGGALCPQAQIARQGHLRGRRRDALCALDDDQQRAAARQAAEKLARRYADLPAREARAKLSQALARRGFGWDAVRDAVEQALRTMPLNKRASRFANPSCCRLNLGVILC